MRRRTPLLITQALIFLAILASAFNGGESAPGKTLPPGSSRTRGVVEFRLPAGGLSPARGEEPLDDDHLLLENLGFDLRPLFSGPESRRGIEAASGSGDEIEFEEECLALRGRWRVFSVPEGSTMEESLRLLRSLPSVVTAYAMPKACPASFAASKPPDYTWQQGYVDDAPGGLGVEYCWSRPGGDGKGITIADVEGDWNTSHKDLKRAKKKKVDGEAMGGVWYNHGTAVLGVLVGSPNSFGVTGMAHKAKVLMYSIGRKDAEGAIDDNTPDAILRAASKLKRGDVILIEVQYSGINSDSAYIPVEYFKADFDAVRAATRKGIVVVEAAGNGGEDLDAGLYENRFDRTVRDSGAILVGAGGPPGYGADRTALGFSNYGSRVDVQGWGSNVTTTGYGDLYWLGGRNYYYTRTFNGTSSSSATVAGAVACLLGAVKKETGATPPPEEVRALLVATGTPQKSADKHIGPRPDLERALKQFLRGAAEKKKERAPDLATIERRR